MDMKKAKPNYLLRLNIESEFYDRQCNAEHEIAKIGMVQSSDPGRLFEEFTKRFSVLPPRPLREPLRSILSIAESGGGDRDELAFVLLNLFKWSGFEPEKVGIYINGDFNKSPDHVLVYLPAFSRYFDPTSQISKHLEENDVGWVEETARIHYPYPVGISAWAFRGKSSEPTK